MVKWRRAHLEVSAGDIVGLSREDPVSEMGPVALQVGGVGWGWVEKASLFFPPPTQGTSCVTEEGGARMKQGPREAGGRAGPCGVHSPEWEVQRAPSTQTVHKQTDSFVGMFGDKPWDPRVEARGGSKGQGGPSGASLLAQATQAGR